MANIEFPELLEGIKSDTFTLVDLRTREEVAETGKISDARCLPIQELEEALALGEEDFVSQYGFKKPNPKGDALRPVVWYCRSGRRVGLAQEILQRQEYSGYRLYFGSILDWTSKGGPLEKAVAAEKKQSA